MKFLYSLSFLSLYFFVTQNVSGQSTTCDDEYECESETVDGENVYCRGYAACMYSDVTAEEKVLMYGDLTGYGADITSDYDGYCYGSLSCYGATLDIENDFYCEGYGACAYSSITLEDDMITRGIMSCYYAEIDGEDYLYTYGYAVAIYSTISDFTRIYNYGYFALKGAEVETPGDGTTFYMYNYGYYSGYDANVYCQGTDTCYIKCDSTGCDNLVVYYESTATISVTCSDGCATCPEEEEYSSLDELKKSIKYIERQNKKLEMKSLMENEWGINFNEFNDIKTKEDLQSKKFSFKKNRAKFNQIGHKIEEYHGIGVNNVETRNELKNNEKTFTVIHDVSEDEWKSLSNHNSHNNNNSSVLNVQLFSFAIGIIATLVIGVVALFVVSKIPASK